jgi:RNA polymerase sigma-70 factor (ECF subfamily)
MLAMTLVDPTRPARAAASRAEVGDDVVARAARGDQAAARVVFDHYHRQVHGYVWRMLAHRANRALVEDLAQDTFLRGFGALRRFDPRGDARLSTWLLAIATRVVLNELRRQRRKPDATVDVTLIALPGGAAADEQAQRRALGAMIARAIEELAPDFRAVFVLREYEDRSLEEIAAALEIPVGTVQSRLGRARAALREALKGVG